MCFTFILGWARRILGWAGPTWPPPLLRPWPRSLKTCDFQRETEILFFLVIVVMIRTRKSGSVSMINYLSSSFVYTKVANLILWFNADFLMGTVYGIIFVRK
jgi:hypothetical protein